MASSSCAGAPKRCRASGLSSSLGADFADAISSSETEDDVDTSDFSTDDEDAPTQAGTSSG